MYKTSNSPFQIHPNVFRGRAPLGESTSLSCPDSTMGLAEVSKGREEMRGSKREGRIEIREARWKILTPLARY